MALLALDIIIILLLVNICVTAGVASLQIYNNYQVQKQSQAAANHTSTVIFHRLDTITNASNILFNKIGNVTTYDTAILSGLTNLTAQLVNKSSNTTAFQSHHNNATSRVRA